MFYNSMFFLRVSFVVVCCCCCFLLSFPDGKFNPPPPRLFKRLLQSSSIFHWGCLFCMYNSSFPSCCFDADYIAHPLHRADFEAIHTTKSYRSQTTSIFPVRPFKWFCFRCILNIPLTDSRLFSLTSTHKKNGELCKTPKRQPKHQRIVEGATDVEQKRIEVETRKKCVCQSTKLWCMQESTE